MGVFPSQFAEGELERRIRRIELEAAVQNMVGPIVNIRELSDPTLYGMRDRWRRDNMRRWPDGAVL